MGFDYHDAPMARPHEQIRLLRLRATDDHNASIEADLHVYALDESPAYTAISYTWGDTLPTIEISVNGRPFRARMNCWHALWQMRYHQEQDNYYWIDSICINQNDVQEKNVQVLQMGDIYRKALMTASCLGRGSHLAVLSNPELSLTDRKDALARLHQKDYWSRTWIKQEIILSKDIRLFCGSDWHDWGWYEAILTSVTNTSQRSVMEIEDREVTVARAHTALVLDRLRLGAAVSQEDSDHGPSTELWRLLERYGDAECHDPRDKIYALLSLLPDSGRAALNLPIDYECELATLWFKFVRSCLWRWRTTMEVAQTECRTLPLTMWILMERMAQHWFRLGLDEPVVRNFIAGWHHESSVDTPGAGRVKVLYTIDHVSIAVKSQLRISEYQDDIRFPLQKPAFAQISAAIPVSEVDAWLEEVTSYDVALYSGYKPSNRPPHAMRPFTLSGLPSDVQVRVVIAKVTAYHRPSAFLVPAFVELGDQLLGCDMLEHVDAVWQAPIVRFNGYRNGPRGRERQSMLVGWALQLQSDGILRDDMKSMYPIPEDGFHGVSWCVFNLHYEDLMLQALLKQDSMAYLTHPRLHSIHPSFLTEYVPTKTEAIQIEAIQTNAKETRRRRQRRERRLL